MDYRPKLSDDQLELFERRSAAFRSLSNELPGAKPYDNLRPINVPGRFDGSKIYDVMTQLHPHITSDEWQAIFRQGRIRKDGTPVDPSRRVRGGEQLTHLFPDTTEPSVNADVALLWEDDDLVAISKPAPLPMHPSGRFNFNTLTHLMSLVYKNERLRPAHRLDANTTGVVLFARNTDSAQFLQSQFESGKIDSIEKEYRVQCLGQPNDDAFESRQPIAKRPGRSGLRVVAADGRPSLTEFQVLQRVGQENTILRAFPRSGRTNQIRVHLWDMQIPVIGDPLYLPNRELGESQTLPVDAPAMCLHAHRLTIVHPGTKQPITFQAELPGWSAAN